ncbi:MAG: hypothetical protein U9R23_07680 [Candidatus Cloacimonadota bacterium]|nr:hypothetical protein [Candidatus Cloacimonadota bacterium]
MGKVLIIIVLLLTAIFAAITLSVQHRAEKAPEMLSQGYGLRNVGTYALRYAIKQIKAGSITSDITTSFDDFIVLTDGRINSIKYDFEYDYSGDSTAIDIIANVSWITPDDTLYHECEAVVRLQSSGSTIYQFGDYALTTAGTIRLKGQSSATPNKQNTEFTFENIFGMTQQEAKDYATSKGTCYEGGTDPGHGEYTIDDFTWIEGDYHPTSWNISSGILIVNGNLHSSAHVIFTGVIYVIGTFFPTAWTSISGAVFVEYTGQTELSGHATIDYDKDVLDSLGAAETSLGAAETSTIKILYWRE